MMEVNVISPEGMVRLEELEAVIRKGLKGFVRVGMALKEIKKKKLYLGTHKKTTSLMGRLGVSLRSVRLYDSRPKAIEKFFRTVSI